MCVGLFHALSGGSIWFSYFKRLEKDLEWLRRSVYAYGKNEMKVKMSKS
jgi:hypothetical protein